MKGTEIYFRNVVRRWQRAAGVQSGRVLVLMPYITSSTAESVLRDTDPQIVKIYTVFSAENFASGSSSLRTIRSLHTNRFHLYHLSDLHAKVVIVSGAFASIGSQNLTVQGAKNREATAVFTNDKEVARIESLAETWLDKGQEISIEMIQKMEELLPPLVKEFKKAKQAAVEIDYQVFLEVQRLEEKRLERERLELERLEQERLQRTQEMWATWKRQLRKTISRLPQASQVIYGRVKGSKFVPEGNTHLTNWIIEGQEFSLQPFYRCLCIQPQSRKIGWVRVVKTHIARVQPRLTINETIRCASTDYRVSFKAHWDDIDELESNVSIFMDRDGDSGQMTLQARFEIDSFTIVKQETKNMTPLSEALLAQWISNNEMMFKERLLGLILSPFKYKRNLTGVMPAEFFGSSRYQLTLRRTPLEQPLLVAEEV